MALTLSAETPEGASGPTTRQMLMTTGLRCFEAAGYGGARLTDITREAGLTTGAFYRHFASKVDLFTALFTAYGEELQEALVEANRLDARFVVWIEVSRKYRGVVRAATDLVHSDADAAAARQRLRDRCASILLVDLQGALGWRRARAAAHLLADILDQYVLMETAGWVPQRDAEEVAAALHHLVTRGLYST